MKKRIIFAGALALMALSLGACALPDASESSDVSASDSVAVETHSFQKHDAVAPTCDTAGNEAYYTCTDCNKIFNENQEEIASIPTLEALGHSYILTTGTAATCSEKGVIDHYTCDVCDKLFDLTKQEITDVEADYDTSNHAASMLLTLQVQPNKATYKAGETFDPTGMAVVYKCSECEGEIVDNQFLTYTYETEANVFAIGDTKITVNFNGLAFDVEITVEKEQAQILGVKETYTVACATAPVIEASSNLSDSNILIKYYDGETEVQPVDFLAGKTYIAEISIEETETVAGAKVSAVINVEHQYIWQSNADDANMLTLQCNCGEGKDFYVMNNQEVYVDDTDMSIDLSKLVGGTDTYSITSVRQVLLLNNNEVVDIEGINAGMVYTFSVDKYENLTGDWTPYYLALQVTYVIEDFTVEVNFTAKYVEKVIRTAEDLLALAYTGDPAASDNQITGQYVLANDIDASGLVLGGSNPCWQASSGFCGVFEGNGYTISNLTIPAYSHGLFGAVGYNGKIQNVTFTNLNVANGSYVFAYALRNAFMTNVNIEFNLYSEFYQLAYSANACEFDNVNITTCKGENPFFIDENASAAMPETITFNYFVQYMVCLDTNGGNEMEAIAVTIGRKIPVPETPVKTSEEYDYNFLGWFYEGSAWDFDNGVVMDDMTLVAQWEEVEKVDAEALIAEVTAKIAVLPDSVTMPDHIYFVSRILEAKAAYNALDEDLKAQVTNYAKLESLLSNISGYETVHTQSVESVNVVPSHVPNYTSTIGGTATTRTDDLYGNVLTVTPDAGGKVAIQYKNFPDVSKYTKVYICVRVIDASCNVYMSDGIINDGWGNDWKNNWSMDGYWANANNWMIMTVDTSTKIIASDWAIGLRTDATDVAFEVADIIGYYETLKATSLTFGTMASSGTTNEYGQVYNLTQGWASDSDLGAFNPGALGNALPSGYDSLCFWIYNPNAIAVDFKVTGDMNAWNPQGDYVTTLAAQSWTKVVLTPQIIAEGANGTWFVGVTTGAGTSGWQISNIYAMLAE